MRAINFCENNFTHGTEDVVVRLKKEAKDVKVEVESCLGYCSDCAMQPFAVVDDEMVLAESPEELYSKIMELIE